MPLGSNAMRQTPTPREWTTNSILVVMDGRRLLARARHIPAARGWLLKAYGFSWADPRAHEPNIFGAVDPRYLIIKTKCEAKRILADLTAQVATP